LNEIIVIVCVKMPCTAIICFSLDCQDGKCMYLCGKGALCSVKLICAKRYYPLLWK